MHVTPMQVSHLEEVAQIHAEALAGDFLPCLGWRFLHVFYKTALEKGAAFGFVQVLDDDDGKGGQRPPDHRYETSLTKPVSSETGIAGFVLGSSDTSSLFRSVILGAPFALAWAAFPAILRNPGLLIKVVETFLYPGREAAGEVKAELVVIAVKPNLRSQGVGQVMVGVLNAAFQRLGVKTYKVTVIDSNAGANRFYQRLGFQWVKRFKQYQQDWNLYIYHLAEASP